MSAPFIRLPGTTPNAAVAQTSFAPGDGFKIQTNEFPPFPSIPHDSPLNRPLMDQEDLRLGASAWGSKMQSRLSQRLHEARAAHQEVSTAQPVDEVGTAQPVDEVGTAQPVDEESYHPVDGDSCDDGDPYGNDDPYGNYDLYGDDGSSSPPLVHVIAPSPTPSDIGADQLNDQFATMDVTTGSVGLSEPGNPLMPGVPSLAPPMMPAGMHQPFQPPHPILPTMEGEAYWRACAEHWHNMCLDMQRHVSLVCGPLAAPNVNPPFPH